MSQMSAEEPNLTPMLDLVLQILMFFIATTSLSAEQVSADILLPPAQFAKPITNNSDEYVYLNLAVDRNRSQEARKPVHVLNVLGRPEQTTDFKPEDKRDTRLLLQNLADDIKRNTGTLDKVIVVVRADKSATYSELFSMVKTCQEIGFKRLSVRAYINAS
jgi:biopolymer transport protein ExbD